MTDTERFGATFDSTYPALVAYARRRVPAADVDDVVADTFTTAWRRWDTLDDDRAPLPWLYGIAANVIRNRRRSNDRHLRLVDTIGAQPAAPSHDPADVASRADDGAVVRAALASLSDEDQEVLRLVTWEELSHAEAGEALGCSTNAVGIRIHRARDRLAAELARLEQVR